MCAFRDETDLLTNLWKAVIDQAIYDYRWAPVEMTNKSLYRLKCNAKKTVEWWIGSEDFYEVCRLASIRPGDVLKQFKSEGE